MEPTQPTRRSLLATMLVALAAVPASAKSSFWDRWCKPRRPKQPPRPAFAPGQIWLSPDQTFNRLLIRYVEPDGEVFALPMDLFSNHHVEILASRHYTVEETAQWTLLTDPWAGQRTKAVAINAEHTEWRWQTVCYPTVESFETRFPLTDIPGALRGCERMNRCMGTQQHSRIRPRGWTEADEQRRFA